MEKKVKSKLIEQIIKTGRYKPEEVFDSLDAKSEEYLAKLLKILRSSDLQIRS